MFLGAGPPAWTPEREHQEGHFRALVFGYWVDFSACPHVDIYTCKQTDLKASFGRVDCEETYKKSDEEVYLSSVGNSYAFFCGFRCIDGDSLMPLLLNFGGLYE